MTETKCTFKTSRTERSDNPPPPHNTSRLVAINRFSNAQPEVGLRTAPRRWKALQRQHQCLWLKGHFYIVKSAVTFDLNAILWHLTRNF